MGYVKEDGKTPATDPVHEAGGITPGVWLDADGDRVWPADLSVGGVNLGPVLEKLTALALSNKSIAADQKKILAILENI